MVKFEEPPPFQAKKSGAMRLKMRRQTSAAFQKTPVPEPKKKIVRWWEKESILYAAHIKVSSGAILNQKWDKMGKFGILSVLKVLIDRNCCNVEKRNSYKNKIEECADNLFKHSDHLENVSEKGECNSMLSRFNWGMNKWDKNNVDEVKDFLKRVSVPIFNCEAHIKVSSGAILNQKWDKMGKFGSLSILKVLIDCNCCNVEERNSNKNKIEECADNLFKHSDHLENVSEKGECNPAVSRFKWGMNKCGKNNVDEVKDFLKRVSVPIFDCEFNIPQVRTRLEKLMGTNYVSLTDRDYMQRLQERILEDYEEQMDKRIRVREEEEMERVKNLVLMGKIPLDQAPPEMAKHPIMLIENYCNKLIAERRAKIKIYKVKIPTYLYWDDTPDPPSGLSIESGHVFRQGETLCQPVERHLEVSDEEDLENKYMMPQEEFDNIQYESSLVKRLLACETVEEMYALADDIIGILKTIDVSTKVPEDNISETLAST